MNMITALANGALIAAGGIALLLCAFLLLECIAGLRRSASPQETNPSPTESDVRFSILMPAHNEAAGIEQTLSSLMPHVGPMGDVLVVADNCTDDTAALARQSGARVIERHDAERRGKGYALAAGVEALRSAPPAVVIILDADCTVTVGSIQQIAQAAHQQQTPVQAVYRMLPSAKAGPAQRVGAFAWRVKNELRAAGAQRLGIPCPLMGAGMAFPWSVIASTRLASGNLVEDLQLGIDVALAGTPARLRADVVVESQLPDSTQAAARQRARWEHGTLSTIRQQVPRLLSAAVSGRRSHLMGMALDVALPPLAFFSMAVFALTALQALWWLATGLSAALLLGLTSLTLLLATLVIAWWSVGREFLTAGELAQIPLYVLRKLPSYARWLLGRGERVWVRTDRGRKS